MAQEETDAVSGEGMGTFSLRVQVMGLERPTVAREVEVLVDTGATLTALPATILKELGVTPTRRKEFDLRSGHVTSSCYR